MVNLSGSLIDSPDTLFRYMNMLIPDEGFQEYRSNVAGYAQYQSDPAGFCHNVLGMSHITDDIQSVMQSVVDYPVTLARSATETGKSYSAAHIALWFFLVYPDAQVYCLAAPPESNLTHILWSKMLGVIGRNPQVFAAFKRTALYIERNPESFILGLKIPQQGSEQERETRASGKHAPHILFIVDEGNAVPAPIYKGIEGCLSGGHYRMLVLFNPREQLGPAYQLERSKSANVVRLSALSHPNVIQGIDVIPGAVSRETVVRRINLWSRPLAPGEKQDTECFELPEYLVGCVGKTTAGEEFPHLTAGWRKITDAALSYMVLGQYPAQSSWQLIPQIWIEAARARYDAYVMEHGITPPPGVLPKQGLDVAEGGRDLNALTTRYDDFVLPIEVWSGMELTETETIAATRYEEKGASVLYVDKTGLGAGVPPHLQKKSVNAVGVHMSQSPTFKIELGEFGTIRDQLWWSLREWVKSPTSMLPSDAQLEEELATPQYDVYTGKVKVSDRKTLVELLGRSPDRATALALTLGPEMVVEDTVEESTSDYLIISAIKCKEPEKGFFNLHTDKDSKKETIIFTPCLGGDWSIWLDSYMDREYVLAVKVKGEEQGEDKNYFNVVEIFARDYRPVDNWTKGQADVLEQIAEYRSQVSPEEFAEEIYKIHLAYYRPTVFPIITLYDHGQYVIDLLKSRCFIYRRRIIDAATNSYQNKFGWLLDAVSRRQAVDSLVTWLKQEKMIIKSATLAKELSTLGQPGSYSDMALTAAIAIQAHLRIPKKEAMKQIEMRQK